MFTYLDDTQWSYANEMSRFHVGISTWETMAQHPKQEVVGICDVQEQDTEMVELEEHGVWADRIAVNQGAS